MADREASLSSGATDDGDHKELASRWFLHALSSEVLISLFASQERGEQQAMD